MNETKETKEAKNCVEITFKKTVKDEDLHDLLCCALEGGSGYWAKIVEYGNPDNIKCEFKHLDLPFSENGYLMISEIDDEGEVDEVDPHKLNKEAMYKGLQIMADKYPWHFANLIEDNMDAETGDVFLQCSVLGDIVYG